MFGLHEAPAHDQPDQVMIGIVEQHVADRPQLFAAVRGYDDLPKQFRYALCHVSSASSVRADPEMKDCNSEARHGPHG